MRYAWVALDVAGRRRRGRQEAADMAALEAQLSAQNLLLLRARPLRRWGFFSGAGTRLSRRERLWFCFQLRQLLAAGVPLATALADLAAAPGDARTPMLAAALARGLAGGQRFSEALACHPESFDPLFVSLIEAGEASGDLVTSLERLERALQREADFVRETRRLLAYPAITALIMLAAVGFLLLYLVPQLQVFARNLGQTLPWHARLLFALADFLATYGLLLAGFLLLAGIALALLWRGSHAVRLAWDAGKLRLPVIGGISEKLALARITDTLALLYAAGLPVLTALGLARRAAGNRALAGALHTVETSVREGSNLATAFADAGLFPPLVTRMARVGETTGALDTALANVSRFYDREAAAALARVQALLEPGLTLALGLVMGWIVLSVIGPIYDLIHHFRV
ncbi:MAG: type II secretion system F family protein [Zoogloeaceae bacterium]|jgi:type IV pilus assembly protein PilC|nr:type II secretion system F family protein [Zoogloeaceae bacterium]